MSRVAPCRRAASLLALVLVRPDGGVDALQRLGEEQRPSEDERRAQRVVHGERVLKIPAKAPHRSEVLLTTAFQLFICVAQLSCLLH